MQIKIKITKKSMQIIYLQKGNLANKWPGSPIQRMAKCKEFAPDEPSYLEKPVLNVNHLKPYTKFKDE